MVKDSFIVVHRKEGYEKVYQMGNDLVKAMCYQKALLVSDVVDDNLLSIVKSLITEAEISTVVVNLNRIGRDRIANDEEEVYIIFFPERESMRGKYIHY